MNILKELEFIDRIDGNFPYGDRKECIKLMDEAVLISPNASFAVIEEICRIPDEDRALLPFLALLDLLKEIEKRFEHPLKELIVKVASRMIKEQESSLEETLLNLESLKKYPRQFACLNIIFYSCHGDETKLNAGWDEIIKLWDKGN